MLDILWIMFVRCMLYVFEPWKVLSFCLWPYPYVNHVVLHNIMVLVTVNRRKEEKKLGFYLCFCCCL